jgi:hypothetical protein
MMGICFHSHDYLMMGTRSTHLAADERCTTMCTEHAHGTHTPWHYDTDDGCTTRVLLLQARSNFGRFAALLSEAAEPGQVRISEEVESSQLTHPEADESTQLTEADQTAAHTPSLLASLLASSRTIQIVDAYTTDLQNASSAHTAPALSTALCSLWRVHWLPWRVHELHLP